MNILDDLKALQQQHTKPPPTPTTNNSYISDAVIESALFRAGVAQDIINDVLLEPIESRGDWIKYFERMKND